MDAGPREEPDGTAVQVVEEGDEMIGRRTPTFPVLLAAALLLAPVAEATSHVFSKRFGSTAEQVITSVAVDGGGNVIVTGSFAGTIDFGGGTLTSAGGTDIFLAKLDVDGRHVWSWRFGDGQNQAGNGVAVDGAGGVYLTGFFSGTVDFGGGALASAGSRDVFVARFDAAGNHVWSERFGDAGTQNGTGLAVDGSGSVVVVGFFVGSIDFGGGTLTSAGLEDAYLAKLGANGNHIWSKSFGDSDVQVVAGVAVDGSGNVIATGSFKGTVSFGGGALTSAGSRDVFLARFDSAGNHSWSKRFGDSSNQHGTAVAVDASGNPVITGSFEGSADFGGGALTSFGLSDIYLAKLDVNGNHVWSKAFGGPVGDEGLGLAVDGSRDVVLTGAFQESVNFGGGVLACGGPIDFFVARFGPSGVHVSSACAGDELPQQGLTAAFDAAGNVLVAGRFQGTLDLGGGVLTSAGEWDAFLAKLGRGAILHPVTPCRVVDTRNAVGPRGGPALEPAPSNRVFAVAGVCGIPATAKAIAGNITVTQTGASGTLRIYPGDTGLAWIPTATSTSFAVTKTRANNGLFLLSRDGVGSLGVWNDAPGAVHFILDVSGYFE